MGYRIGLDLGISSVGWSVIEHDNNDNPRRIIDLGVRVFDPAENPKDGSSLAVDRRLARGLRRRLRRRNNRIRKVKEILSLKFFNCNNYVFKTNLDVFELRYKALNKQLNFDELSAVILYFVKHRGFKSNQKSDSGNKDEGLLKKAISENSKYKEKYLTLGEYIYKDEKFFSIFNRDSNNTNERTYKLYNVRNHNGKYDNCFAREDLEYELRIILEKQSKYYQEIITTEFIDNIINIFGEQRSFDDGPNSPSPYKSNFAIGKCTIYPSEYRAPKGSFTFEYFFSLNKLNNLTILDENKQSLTLTIEDKNKILDLLFDGKDITFALVRKTINIPDNYRFKNLTYKFKKLENGDEKRVEIDVVASEKASYFKFDKVKLISKALGEKISKDNQDLYDAISYILSMRKSDERRKIALHANDDLINDLTESQKTSLKNLSELQIENLINIDVTKFGNLSFKAMNEIIPQLEKGLVYDKACSEVGIDFKAISKCRKETKLNYVNLIDELGDITSPVVKRTISQTIKVVNAIIDVYGSPSAIFIELGREMALNFRDRQKVKKSQEERQSDNERIRLKLQQEFNIIPTGQDIVKYRLYEEQGGVCAYSLESFEKVLGSPKAIFENNNTQIDHIIPYSQCYDDSYSNKVLVLASENQKKGQNVPMGYMSKEQFDRFQEFVNVQYKGNLKKQEKLLHKPLTEDQITELNSRALNDTRYSSKLIKQILENHLIFAQGKFFKSPVRCVNGNITSYLRKVWGLTKQRFESDKHHAQDAAIIAVATNDIIRKISEYFKYKSYLNNENAFKIEMLDNKEYIIIKATGERVEKEKFDMIFGPRISQPYDLFVKELEARLLTNNPKSKENLDIYQSIGYDNDEIDKVKNIFISRMPTRKVLGAIHKETIRSAPYQNNKHKKTVTTKTDITLLKLNKENEIYGYPEKARNDDKLLYNALRKKLIEFNGDGKLAFKEPFYKPKKDGSQGNPVRTVKIESVVNDGVSINDGFAEKSRMVRVDIFVKDNKHYVVPVYISDVYAQKLPNRAIVAGKPIEEWLDVTGDGFEFKFTLYPNDLVYISNDKPLIGKNSKDEKVTVNNEFLYYTGAHSGTGALSFINNDKSIIVEGAGIQKLNIFKKCTVDVLGNITEVKKNTRQDLNFKSKKNK